MPYSVNPNKPIGSRRSAWESSKEAARNTQEGQHKASCEDSDCKGCVPDPEGKIHKLRWHDMRHGFISTILQAGATAAMVRAIVGHVDNKIIDRYAHSDHKLKQAAVTVLDSMPSLQ